MGRRRRDDDFDYDYFEPKPRIATDRGIKARSRRGVFAQNWWAGRWIEALERVVDAGRLRRGRSYARSGQVLAIQETPDGVQAKVQGSRRTPYKVTIRLTPLTDAQWERIIAQMAEQAIFAAQLLAGEMPPDIEAAFESAGVSLFPTQSDELVTDCTCPDWANPCKHVAATHYILGEQFDEDPFMIFRLRGRTQEQVLQALRARRTEGEPEPPAEEADSPQPESAMPLTETVGRFWQLAERMDTFATTIKPPAVRLPVLKRLGPPAFLADDDLVSLLGPAYEAITQAALAAAFAEPDQSAAGDEGQHPARQGKGRR